MNNAGRSPILLVGLVLFCALSAGAGLQKGVPASLMDDDDGGAEPPDSCTAAEVWGISGRPYLNGLPRIQESVEIVGDRVKVVVETTPSCRRVTPSSLPFQWQVIGPSGAVTLTDEGTLRPHFRPTVAGAYEATITYCPQTCNAKHVGSDVVDIPPQTASFTFFVVAEIPLPPATQPVLTQTALTDPSTEEMEQANAIHAERERMCAFGGLFTPQLVPVRPWVSHGDYELLEGRIRQSRIAGKDNELNHSSHDVGVYVVPDPQHRELMLPGREDVEVEWESGAYAAVMRPLAGDRISAFGFHTYDCHHSPFPTEIHPPVLTAVHRNRPIRIPDNWPSEAASFGTTLYVPGVITDIWANVRAGEMTSNCSDTGLHQEAVAAPPIIDFGDCIKSPHSIRRLFTFNVYLPENPRNRMSALGLAAPPAPLYYRVDAGDAPAPFIVPLTDGAVTYLSVTVNLTGYTAETYFRRIVAGWVQPNPDNWGLEGWKVGISSLRVYEDHDFGTDGDWVFWAGTNNRDQEWTRLLNGNSVGEGLYTFGGRPWETQSPPYPDPDRRLGPHVLLFNPRFGRHFTGPPEQDQTQSVQIHGAGYDDELVDDGLGMVNAIAHPDVATLPVGGRRTMVEHSSTGDYSLTWFFERLGPVTATLHPAGVDLARAYTVGASGQCTPVGGNLCLLAPEQGSVVEPWHPAQMPTRPGDPELDWFAHRIYRAQGPEPFNLMDVPFEVVGRALAGIRPHDPERAERFFTELREEFDEVRGTPMESEFARTLPPFEANLPADLWQRHFGDIDPTPVDLAVQGLSMLPPGAGPGQDVVFGAEIVNRGTGTAAPFNVQFEVDGTALRIMEVPVLAPGATTTIDFPGWAARPGTHTARATADVPSRIGEPREDDNTLERRFIVGPEPLGLADLHVLGVRFEPSPPRTGQAVTFIAQVQNTGGNVLDGFAVTFGVDGANVGQTMVGGLPAGETVEVRSPAWTAIRRRHILRVFVDAPNAVPEKDEANNLHTRPFAVRGRVRRGGP